MSSYFLAHGRRAIFALGASEGRVLLQNTRRQGPLIASFDSRRIRCDGTSWWINPVDDLPRLRFWLTFSFEDHRFRPMNFSQLLDQFPL